MPHDTGRIVGRYRIALVIECVGNPGGSVVDEGSPDRLTLRNILVPTWPRSASARVSFNARP